MIGELTHRLAAVIEVVLESCSQLVRAIAGFD